MSRAARRRPGQISLAALIALPLMLGTLILMVFLFRTRDSLIELRNAGVAASLAAAEDLADDALLTDDPERIRPRLARGRQSADTLAKQNIVEGRRLTLRLTDSEGDPGDVVFGTLDRAVGGHFEKVDPAEASAAEWGRLNAVEVTVRQPNKPSVFTRVTAVLDQSVVGFKPWAEKPAPVVPVALYDAPPDDAEHPTWSQLLRSGKDEWKLERGAHAFKLGADGLPEVKVRVGRQSLGAADEAFGFPLVLGSQSAAETASQIRIGLTIGATERMGGFQLAAGGVFMADGDLDLYRNSGAENQADTAEAAFQALAASGEARVWPVFGGFDEHGRAVLTGFTAARVVSVESAGPSGGLVLRLQPSVVASPTAVTDPTRTGRDGKPFGTRNVVKIRLAG